MVGLNVKPLKDEIQVRKSSSSDLTTAVRPIPTDRAITCSLALQAYFGRRTSRTFRPHRQSLGGHQTSLCESQRDNLARLRLPTPFLKSPQ
jgi:hypothetical protein